MRVGKVCGFGLRFLHKERRTFILSLSSFLPVFVSRLRGGESPQREREREGDGGATVYARRPFLSLSLWCEFSTSPSRFSLTARAGNDEGKRERERESGFIANENAQKRAKYGPDDFDVALVVSSSSARTFYDNTANDDFKSVLPSCVSCYFWRIASPERLPRVIKEQQQKYIFQTGTNRLDYYRDGLNTNHQKEEVGDDHVREAREESEDEARLEEKSSHESSLSLSRFGSEKTREDDDVSESADTSGLDYASLPRVLLKGDKLQCKCGSWKCESFDQPRVSFVISREIEDVGELLNVLNSIDAMDGDEGKDCEVLVNGDGLKSSSSSSKDNGEDGINALIAMIRKQGGFTNNLASYRNEPLERIVIVKSESGNNKNDDGVMLERLVSGALAAKVRFVENAGNVREETPMELKTTVLKRLRAVDSSSSSSSGSSSSSTPTSKADVHPRVSFAVQYFKRPNLVQKIATQLAGYAD